MQTENKKYLSILTNFGCHYECPYCIIKKTGIRIPKTTISSLDSLEKFLLSGKYNIVSLSGGGDPLFNFDKHQDYYTKLFNLLEKYKIPLELHTSYIINNFPAQKAYRIVYHCNLTDPNRSIEKIKRKSNEIIRVVYVVTEDLTEEKALEISNFLGTKNVDEISFRQRIDENYEINYHLHDFLKKYHKKKWFYIEQGDYNTYFAEGEISQKYQDFMKKYDF